MPGIRHRGFHGKTSSEESSRIGEGPPELTCARRVLTRALTPQRGTTAVLGHQHLLQTPSQNLPGKLLCQNSREVMLLLRQSLA